MQEYGDDYEMDKLIRTGLDAPRKSPTVVDTNYTCTSFGSPLVVYELRGTVCNPIHFFAASEPPGIQYLGACHG